MFSSSKSQKVTAQCPTVPETAVRTTRPKLGKVPALCPWHGHVCKIAHRGVVMRRFFLIGGPPLWLVLAGCPALNDGIAPEHTAALAPGESTTPIVPSDLFGEVPVPPPVQVAYTPAANDATARVLAVAQRLQAKNPQLSIHPVVLTSAQPHRHQPPGRTQIIITEGLVRQCQSATGRGPRYGTGEDPGGTRSSGQRPNTQARQTTAHRHTRWQRQQRSHRVRNGTPGGTGKIRRRAPPGVSATAQSQKRVPVIF